MAYGDKRDFPKIDLYVNGEYKASTTWAGSCKEARSRYWEANPGTPIDAIHATFAKE